MFNGTVFDNISNGLVGTKWENAPREKQLELVQSAAGVAFAHQFIMKLPQGYDTRIGERGGLLSGGQKQRIAIARSVVSSPKVLLMDEATSALDPHAEGVVQQALDRVSRDCTTIVIAHKLATIKHADNIVVMSKGSIVEQGTHQSLLAIDGAYAQLVKAQDLSFTSAKENNDISLDSQSDEEELDDDSVAKILIRHNTSDQHRLEALSSRDDYDNHKPFGVLSAIFHVVKATPELRFHFLVLLIASILAGKSTHFHPTLGTLSHLFPIFPRSTPLETQISLDIHKLQICLEFR